MHIDSAGIRPAQCPRTTDRLNLFSFRPAIMSTQQSWPTFVTHRDQENEEAAQSSGCPFAHGQGNGAPTSIKPRVTYEKYLHVDRLLESQEAEISGGIHHHDEHMFIVIHQVFELWFKQIIRELESARNLLMNKPGEREVGMILDRILRSNKILQHATGGFDVMCTMHPADFLEFRDFIGPASGFESLQMRVLETLIGLRDNERTTLAGEPYTSRFSPDQVAYLMKYRTECKDSPDGKFYSIREALDMFLSSLDVPEKFREVYMATKERNLRQQHDCWGTSEEERQPIIETEMSYVNKFFDGECAVGLRRPSGDEDTPEVRDMRSKRNVAIVYLLSYRDHPQMQGYAKIIEAIVGFEQTLLLWRNEHARMAEYMIGRRPGTGGSSGVQYLDSTRHYRIFTELWQARSVLLKSSTLPALESLK